MMTAVSSHGIRRRLHCSAPFFLRLRAGLPSFTNSNNPRALEPESADLKPRQISANPVDAILIAARDNFIVSVNNLSFAVCPDRPQWPEGLDKNEPTGKECECLANLCRASPAMYMALSLASSWGPP